MVALSFFIDNFILLLYNYVTFELAIKPKIKKLWKEILIMEKENINNYKKILGYIEKIEILSQYMSNKEILQMTKEDFQEIKQIQNELRAKRNVKICISK